MSGPEPIRLVVGLGNPGPEYERTRHNLGFWVLDRLVPPGEWEWRGKWKALCAARSGLLFCKPQTFMNLSGQAVAAIASFYKVPPRAVLVVLDDLSLELGRIRIRAGGSAGGHNGLKSIIASLGTQEIPRVRVGIGSAENRDTAGYVLGAFSAAELRVLEESLPRAEEAVRLACSEGLDRAMNAFN